MGVYSNGHVYGVSISLDNDILFYKIYDRRLEPGSYYMIKDFYDDIPSEKRKHLQILLYTLCSSTASPTSQPFMTWFPVSRETFEALLV
jgi:hypothetical protein